MTTIIMINPASSKFIQVIFVMLLMLQVEFVSAEEVRCIESERQVLLNFKASLVDPDGFLCLSTWGAEEEKRECCQWKGVGCSNQTSHVEILDIGDCVLRGEIPIFLTDLQHLKHLDLSSNELGGSIPHQLGYLPKLQYLDLRYNNLGGSLPSEFGNLSNLQFLDLRDNNLEGIIPSELGNLSNLQVLALSSNRLEGIIPSQLGKLSNLHTLFLGFNVLKFDNENHMGAQLFSNLTSLTLLNLSEVSNLNNSNTWLQMIGKLPKLILLQLQSCSLSNDFFLSLDHSKFTFPASLTDLYLSNNPIKLSIMKFFMNICTLRSLVMDNTNLIEELSTLFHHLSFGCLRYSLEELDLSHNYLSGTIPDCWSNFTSLAYIDLSNNNLCGQIPSTLGSAIELQALILRKNSLIGNLPSSLRSCTKLVMLDVGENKLSGVIPFWIGSTLQHLQMLSLRRNHFSEKLPLSLCYLSNIYFLDLSSNNLNGQIPKCFKNFSAMTGNGFSSFNTHYFSLQGTSQMLHDFKSYSYGYDLIALLMWKGVENIFKNDEFLLKGIDLSSNQLTNEIPSEIEDLVGLVSLNLSRNNLSGKIPQNIGRLTSLDFLDLSRNHLSGSIPSSLTQIDRLGMLDLSHNHLSGKIPTGTQLQSFNASSYEDNLNLCGLPLQKLCTEEEPLNEPLVKFDEDEDSLLCLGFYISMAFGFVIGFWGIIGPIAVKRSWRHAYFRFFNNIANHIYVRIAITVANWKLWLRD
ncbi:unnamed protein product [Lupinus luteus]|uniref:Leucine-rich repeat-containing N-terminal plant-type domain-containing protein n=1 Tax=Lupinus luteus TaxID=3873 RepID=A0AAV1YK25_LUPLU